jgi:hypothetical protein
MGFPKSVTHVSGTPVTLDSGPNSKEGRGEVECRRLYPTQPPLTKGRRQRRVRVSRPFMNNLG